MSPFTPSGDRTVPDRDEASRRVKVGVGDLAVSSDGATLTTSGLGSCVAIALVDPATDTRGLLHAMLPSADGDASHTPRPAKYVDAGLNALLEELASAGASPARLEARLVGGAEMLDLTAAVGPRNVASARESLDGAGIPVVAADVGDAVGRTVRFRPDGSLAVRAADGFERTL
ncbi:chemotaxis protein CheD [Halorubrum halodurans]|uniref:Probable chemoreceptor glutamine deamidase CheD n=1 Tax=Halorubrum halodurans TaxID=1383851 RepID=A0A256IQT9_9EURY|nr:chemotaxis protein CheD [Halorubrum halodurans]OYR58666.1 chemotaxis protein CheD [Halorubrum halodurans]